MIVAALLGTLLGAGTIHGTVRADPSHEPIFGAVVEVVDLALRVSTDAQGYFALAGVPSGQWRVRALMIGYRPIEREVDVPPEGTVRVDLLMEVQPIALTAIEVAGEGAAPGHVPAAGPLPLRVGVSTINLQPGLAEADVFRAVQSLPAVSSASDFSSALYMRGGSPDQTLVLLDGAPLFNPYHLGGVFAAIDPDAVASVEVVPGALPPASGERLSGEVTVWTREGGRDRVRGHGALGLVSTRAGVEGPLPGRGGSFFATARRTYLDLVTRGAHALGLIPNVLPYGFEDVHFKVTHDVGAGGSVMASAYLNRERLQLDQAQGILGDADWRWGTRAGSLRYRRPIGGGALLEVLGAVSVFHGEFSSRERAERAGAAPTLVALADMRDLLGHADVTWPLPGHRIRIGAQVDRYRFVYDIDSNGGTLAGYFPDLRRADRLLTVAGYVEDEWQPVEGLRVRAGVRALYADGIGTAWLPRFGARFALSSDLALTAGGGRYAQAVHTLRDEESIAASLFAYDLLVAVSSAVGLATADDAVVGIEWRGRRTRVRIDAFNKWFRNIPIVPLSPDPLRAPVLAQEIRRGEGMARGVELLARYVPSARSAITATYALAWSDRRLDDERYSPRFERRHTLDVLAIQPLGEAGQVGFRVVLGTGQPYTPPVGRLPARRFDASTGRFVWSPRGDPVVLGDHNSARLPGYFRLDVSGRKEIRRCWFGKEMTVTPYLQVLNVLNTRNVLTAEAGPSGTDAHLEYSPQLPILPTFGVEWRF